MVGSPLGFILCCEETGTAEPSSFPYVPSSFFGVDHIMITYDECSTMVVVGGMVGADEKVT